jgi:hypothetical protein
MQWAQAAYGELNKGHALLAASPGATISSSIINQMDLRGSVPPGVNWEPYFSGFPHGQFYVLARTAPDHSAVRPGMVRSRALIGPLDKVERIESIAGAFEFLNEHFHDQAPLEDVEIDTDRDVGTPHQGLVAAVVNDFQKTIVWPFESGFEAAVINLWHNLWPEARRSFSFRLAFSPQDIPDRPTVVKTLAGLKSRWAGYPLVKANGASEDAASAMLMGLPQGDEIKALMATLNAKLGSYSQLQQLAEISRVLTGGGDFADLVAAIRLVCFLSPVPTDGVSAKKILLKRTSASFAAADTSLIRMSRNLDLTAISDADMFWSSLQKWIRDRLANETPADASTVLLDTERDGPTSEWKSSIIRGLREYLQSALFDIKCVSRVATYDSRTIPIFVKQAGSKNKFDNKLAAELLVSGKATHDVLAQAAAEGLILTHAACCAAMFDPTTAVLEHSENVKATKESIEIALSRSSDQEIVAIAVQQGLPILIEIAASKAAVRPNLIGPLDINQSSWRNLWLQVLQHNIAAFMGPRKPDLALYGLLDSLLAGSLDATGTDLLDLLSRTALASILNYQSRAEIWSKLPVDVRMAYLEATATAWISEFPKVSGTVPPEQPLKEILLSPARIDAVLSEFSSNIALGCAFFRMFGELQEAEFRKWLFASITNLHLGEEDAAAIGRLIAARDWENIARDLADWCLEGRQDILPAMEICRDQIGFIRRYRLDLFGSLAPYAKWRILEEIGIDLYPIGPGDRGLWERAGGKNGDIPRASSGSEGWRIVVQEMEQGRRRMDPVSLIKEMANDFPYNHALRKMRYDRFFG